MEDQRPIESPTIRAHKRQFAWQILVPFLVAAAVIIAAAVLVVTGTDSMARTWADVSIIWLIAPMLIVALLFVIVLGFLIYGIARLMQVTPIYTGKAQDFFAMFSGWLHTAADAVTKPLVWIHQAGAILKSIFKL
jgi:predicted PurR-regulated permease PerM